MCSCLVEVVDIGNNVSLLVLGVSLGFEVVGFDIGVCFKMVCMLVFDILYEEIVV